MRRRGQLMAVLAMLVVSAGITHASATPGQKCAIAKSKAASKKIDAKIKCWQKAFAKGVSTADASCLMAAETKFTDSIMKAEAKGGCIAMGDAGTIEGVADACVTNVVAVTPTVMCQTANITCHCGAITTFVTAMCGNNVNGDCAAIRTLASQNCALNGAPPNSCAAVPCTDACNGGASCG
jgi:hypothetical protein